MATTLAAPSVVPNRSRWMIIALGALTVGTLDILDATTFFWFRTHTSPERIFQSIAAGLLGRASFSGGAATAVLGGILHFEIATIVVFTFYGMSRIIPALARRPFLWGPVYGVAVYLVMNYIVLPLSASGGGGTPKALAVLINGVAIHIVGVGIPSAVTARAATLSP